ncbi:MAG: hypothetical protein D6798_19135 [Deltaproteobacteria bacterium]|nr:MAG: hypothetical protein D6798_19135 [Deltaproteobacteria bacterium]
MYLSLTREVAVAIAPIRYYGRVDLYVIVVETMLPVLLFVVGVALAERVAWPRTMAVVWWLVILSFDSVIWSPWARCEVGPRDENCVGSLSERMLQ